MATQRLQDRQCYFIETSAGIRNALEQSQYLIRGELVPSPNSQFSIGSTLEPRIRFQIFIPGICCLLDSVIFPTGGQNNLHHLNDLRVGGRVGLTKKEQRVPVDTPIFSTAPSSIRLTVPGIRLLIFMPPGAMSPKI